MDIYLNNLTLEIDNKPIVKGLTTKIRSGELVSILGPSGCGKSTTLLLLAGLYKPTSGQLFFGDKDVTNIEAKYRGIGMVFQNYALFPHLSIIKNIMFPLKMQKVRKKDAQERAMEMAKLVHIDHLVNRKPRELSGGQQQRVAIARALVKKPMLLLFDEPLSNLDSHLRIEIREEIRRIQLEVGITTVFVTHDQNEAMSISDKIIIMDNGQIQQESKPKEMYNYPKNIFTASFIGTPPINLLKATLTTTGVYTFVDTQSTLNLNYSYKNIIVGIRPEHLFLTTENNALFTGKITYIETNGHNTLIKVELTNQIIRLSVDYDISLSIGDTCYIGAKEGKFHYFDQNKNRLP